MADLKTYSVLIRWNDMDLDQGEYGTTVRATSRDEAERMAREEMRAEGEDDDGGECGGSVLELCEGAIWKAKEMEDALRGLLRQVDEMANRCGWADHGEREAARKIIAEIDEISAPE